ncbi:amidase [Nocardioides nitrophenolicus]|uniref:amidase n=1 Tax=Nocardioides nitrophenolicus TaxID=60489 RepID=UPI001958EE9F|nr:amidase [Nocardioides nitrophenolicus]MBM7517082.1 Asp-tRNA(Asn)/Glu-tRNA(Gln) amidotransferase A subunit family amidase [Nocardioides nitrophenolicus]
MEPTATAWREQLRRGELSAVELCEHYLARLDAVAHLNAVVARDDEAARAAAAAADARIRAGEDGPLLGIPLTVKDGLDAVGMPCRTGSLARADQPVRDAEVVRRVKAAGAVVLGKTNMPELGMSYETDNRVYGRTDHPFDPRRTPGGSSGGEGAVLGADASPLGIGTDGGGSIRVPSAFCGLFGLRPTTGRVPGTGAWPPGRAGSTFDLTCVGPMGRGTADIASLLGVLAGPDLVDPFAPPVPFADWTAVDVSRLRVGWYVEDGVAAPVSEVRAAVEKAAVALGEAGATVVEVVPPAGVRRATEYFFRATAADGGERLLDLVGDRPEDHVPQFLELVRHPPYGGSTSAADYFALLQEIFDLRAEVRRWVADYDVVLAPVVAGPAPLHGEPPAGVPGERYLRYESFNYTHTYSIAGLPAGSAPVAVSDGLPIGVQVVAPAWREDLVLAAQQVLEDAFGGFAMTDHLRAWTGSGATADTSSGRNRGEQR